MLRLSFPPNSVEEIPAIWPDIDILTSEEVPYAA